VGNLLHLHQTQVRISEEDAMSAEAVWPHSIEVCICRVPIRKRDGYSVEMLEKFAQKLKTHMVRNGVVFLICYAPIEDKSRPFEVCKIMTSQGFTHIDNIVVQKSWFPGKKSEINLVNSHEFVLHFCNGDTWKLDRIPIKDYLKMPEETSCPGNTWRVEVGSLDDSYPVDLAELLLRMADCLPGSIILDVFMGSTAGLRAAIALGHSFYGFERDGRKLKQYRKLIQTHMDKYKIKVKE